MNPQVVAHKRFTYGNTQPLVYNDIAEFELGFAYTAVALPGDSLKGRVLEPHHNTWRVPGAKQNDKMMFYAAQGMITSSMKFSNEEDGWQRHNHPRMELLEYQVENPVASIRTFAARGIPDFTPDLPG